MIAIRRPLILRCCAPSQSGGLTRCFLFRWQNGFQFFRADQQPLLATRNFHSPQFGLGVLSASFGFKVTDHFSAPISSRFSPLAISIPHNSVLASFPLPLVSK